MRSRSGARITRSLRTSGARLSHEQKALEHGRARWRDSRARDQGDDRSFLRSGGAEFAEEEVVAQASCLWGKWASRPFLFDSTGKMPVGPTGKMPVLQRAHLHFADVELQRFPRDAQKRVRRIS